MTRRERILAICVGGAVAGVALSSVVKWTILDPIENAKKAIRAEQTRAARLKAELKALARVEQDWQGLTKRTFSLDGEEAQRRFRRDMHQLLDRHGLKEPKVSPGALVRYKDDSVGAPLNISASGTLNQIVGFLVDFYRRDYLARLDKVRITADQGAISSVNSERARGGRGNRGGGQDFGPNGPEMKISMSAVTLVLPKIEELEHPVIEGDPVELPDGRLLRKQMEYTAIYEANPFEPYVPTQVIASKPPDPDPGKTRERPPPPEPPKEDLRKDAHNFVLKAVTRMDGEYYAYVYDERSPQAEPHKYKIGDDFDNGTLLLVHPRGAVARAEEDEGDVDWFYPLRFPEPASFADREELDPDVYPDVWEALQQAYVWEELGSAARGG